MRDTRRVGVTRGRRCRAGPGCSGRCRCPHTFVAPSGKMRLSWVLVPSPVLCAEKCTVRPRDPAHVVQCLLVPGQPLVEVWHLRVS